MSSDSDNKLLSQSPRRTNSCPDIRDGVAITPARPFTTHYDLERVAEFKERLHSEYGNPSHSTEESENVDETDITEAHVAEEESSKPEEQGQAIIEGPNEDEERDLPAPSWEEYPPLPDLHPLRFWHWRFWWHGLRKLFGYEGTVDVKENVSLFWKILFDSAQIIVSITFLALAAHIRSPTDPSTSERAACHKPIQSWIIVWIVRLFLSSTRSVWATRRNKLLRYLKAHPPPPNDIEAAAADNSTTHPIPGAYPDTEESHQERIHHDHEHNQESPAASRPASRNTNTPRLPYSRLFSQFSALLLLFGIAWWFVAQVFLYSGSSCRQSSPHLWWTLFALVCVQYFAVAELFLFAILVFIIIPICLLLINSVLLCLGRPPVVAPTRIHPEIGKLPKETVARIPLVMYIPHPSTSWHPAAHDPPSHSYPPKEVQRPISSNTRPKWIPFGSSSKRKQTDEWESQWEPGTYPFVRLGGSRATCHICLEEFQEPKRRSTEITNRDKEVPAKIEAGFESADDNLRTGIKWIQRFKSKKPILEDPLKLEAAGDGAQPLRLLACGHVFHRTCIDPWLVDVSGRCPVCQRAVELDPKSPTTADDDTTSQ